LNLEHMLKEVLVSEGAVCRFMEPMSSHTTFRIGGPAEAYVCPGNEDELGKVICMCREHDIPWNVLGNGSNLLVSDRGIKGVVIAMEGNWCYAGAEGSVIRAGAGELLGRVARVALDHCLTGMEFAAGIPGSVGGALVMNAGAYGSEIKNILKSARVMTNEGEVLELSVDELELGYRTSCIPHRGYTVLEASFQLEPGDQEAVEARMKELAARRQQQVLETAPGISQRRQYLQTSPGILCGQAH
jgi:UDP-N-acetylmuramate dehydrogenase